MKKPSRAYCGHCSEMVTYYKTKCRQCERPIFELVARIHGTPVRTTSKTYAKLLKEPS